MPMAFLVPDILFRDVTHITVDFLRQRDIRALVLDVDNTLTAHGSQVLCANIAEWLQTVRAAGIKLMLASNNTQKRVAPFAEKLGLQFASFCCKPSPRWLVCAKKNWELPRRHIALVGDQIFTDLLAGRLWGAPVLMVRPMYEDSKPTVRLKRMLEKPLIRRYFKKGGELL